MSVFRKDQNEVQRAATLNPLLEAIIANPATPKEELGTRLNEHGNLSFGAKKYAEAATYFARARDAGHTDQDLLLNLARSTTEHQVTLLFPPSCYWLRLARPLARGWPMTKIKSRYDHNTLC